jgi:hypothetical protein
MCAAKSRLLTYGQAVVLAAVPDEVEERRPGQINIRRHLSRAIISLDVAG